VINLLSNAIKFTSRGGTIEVSSWVDEQGACMVSVVDSGCGIAKQDLDKVLDPFVQAENAMTRRHEGTGLGLPLVKEYMDLHGGTLDLESTLGVGTTVTIRFPPERLIQPFEDHDVRSTA
jgi:signal transduction histidine kinase